MSSFYVNLPSNTNMDIYPDNTLAKYKTQLFKPIVLDRAYEVSIVSLQYPLSFTNIRHTIESIPDSAELMVKHDQFSGNDIHVEYNAPEGEQVWIYRRLENEQYSN